MLFFPNEKISEDSITSSPRISPLGKLLVRKRGQAVCGYVWRKVRIEKFNIRKSGTVLNSCLCVRADLLTDITAPSKSTFAYKGGVFLGQLSLFLCESREATIYVSPYGTLVYAFVATTTISFFAYRIGKSCICNYLAQKDERRVFFGYEHTVLSNYAKPCAGGGIYLVYRGMIRERRKSVFGIALSQSTQNLIKKIFEKQVIVLRYRIIGYVSFPHRLSAEIGYGNYYDRAVGDALAFKQIRALYYAFLKRKHVWVGAEDRQVHFESLSLGGGSNMALPIWGLFMQKCRKDASLKMDENETFMAPPGISLNLNCDGSDADAEIKAEESTDYFFE